MAKVLYVNHRRQQCGVYEFGKAIAGALQQSKKHLVKYGECDSFDELNVLYREFPADVIIYNYHPETMRWIKTGKYDPPVTYKLPAVHIGTIHEVYQQAADHATDDIFDFHIAPDPTLLLKNPIVFKTGRLLPQLPQRLEPKPGIPVVGSFGFATNGKGFDKIIIAVQKEFDEAIIRLNIPFAKFGDEQGENAKRIADQCRQLINKPGIKLEIDHSYLDKQQLLNFLADNSINVFLYDDMGNRGISSATDWAIAAGRPLAISKSRLFRHLFHCRPGICVEDMGLTTILQNGTKPVEHLWRDWSPEGILWEYDKLIDASLTAPSRSKSKTRTALTFFAGKVLAKAGLSLRKIKSNVWTSTTDEYTYQAPLRNETYQPVQLPAGFSYNRILDNEARKIYEPTIAFLWKHLPHLMKKKIAEANVQQAFVLDTAVRLSKHVQDPAMLAVGAFEDTAAQGLKILDYRLDEIDPILNYDLATFKSKPFTKPASYDIIISTSVIEHVPDDEQFVADIEYLLKPNGFAIITCDYNDKYVKGDDIPDVDCRFYTKKDLEQRLLSKLPSFKLINTPQWDCPNPDFHYLNKYNYTFATFVVQKVS